jgi:NAD(P)-dependent dehydrogenase (short-subunit alcohol dehydrogenase family)
MNRLKDKVAVVTGAGAGIGREIALLFAEEGARVGCMDVDADAANETVEMVRTGGAIAYASAVDISAPGAVVAARDALLSRFGDAHILVNNAGVGVAGTVESLDIERWRRGMEVNFSAAFYMAQAFWPGFVRLGGGVIINNSSVMGLAGDINSVAYSSAKAGLVGMTKCLAADGAAQGIRVNCVCPGFVDTPAMRAQFNLNWTREQAEGRIPLKRLATTREVANVFLFLASRESSYMTGSTLVVDGGATLGYQGSDLSASLI